MQAVHAPGNRQLDAAHDGIVARVCLGHAAVHEGANVNLVVEELGQAVTQAHDLAGEAQQRGGRALVDTQRQVGLWQARVLLDVEQQVAELVGGVGALLVHAAHDEVEANGKASKEAGAARGADGHDRRNLR